MNNPLCNIMSNNNFISAHILIRDYYCKERGEYMNYKLYHRKRHRALRARKAFFALAVGILIIISMALLLSKGNIDNNRKKTGSTDKISGFYIQQQDIVLKNSEKDLNIRVYISKDNKIVEMGFEDYVRGVVAGEMPAEFGLEALKAQAVAARTFALAHMKSCGGTPCSDAKGADVCDTVDCQVYMSKEDRLKDWPEDKKNEYWDKLTEAVTSTAEEVITYNGIPIQNPYYFSTSSGKTEDSQDIFAFSQPYLKSVVSSGDKDAPKYKSSKSISYNELCKTLKNEYSNFKIGNAANLKNNVAVKSRTKAGSVKEIKIGSITISGTKFRSLFKLNSANFSLAFKPGQLIINCTGYGHDVGMSQWGANAMAKSGSSYKDILKHYYTDVNIMKISDLNLD